MSETISYKSGYKYQLQQRYVHTLHERFAPVHGFPILTDYVWSLDGRLLTIREGYAWDGASGPMPDLTCVMRASLVHDALYQLIRLGYLYFDSRILADEELRAICAEDHMDASLIDIMIEALRVGGNSSAMPSAEHPVLEAP